MNLQLHHKIVIQKVMVKAMQYQEFHEIINLEHRNDDDGKSNEVFRIQTHVDPEIHESMNNSLDILRCEETQQESVNISFDM